MPGNVPHGPSIANWYCSTGRPVVTAGGGRQSKVRGKVIERLAHDIEAALPDLKGLSRANLIHMRPFADAWPDAAIVQQPVGQLPWGHNLSAVNRT
ncbi:DUF1016 N-terminal domain-containing protein [Burkholderia pyrrocinia]|uniref:DUF1016 N-terminal domain-containing protein n=1 Tax=Burkholderia pyrrocinia TaxID=60550 RepID=UPI003D769D6D